MSKESEVLGALSCKGDSDVGSCTSEFRVQAFGRNW